MAKMFFFLLLVASCSARPCEVDTKSGQEVCDDFCNYRCSFYNASLGETAGLKNVTLYRITPKNVTGIKNKDTGDAPGDIGFLLSKKNLTQQCARDPTDFGCFLDGDNIYGQFEVEIESGFGPYFECNPVNKGAREGPSHWVDTRDFMCGQGCLMPNASGCQSFRHDTPKNGTTEFGGYQCHCDGTARHNKTVGREKMPYSSSGDDLGPSYWVPQCKLSYYEYYDAKTKQYGGCLDGDGYRTVRGWDLDSTLATACNNCDADSQCTGWRTLDNLTATLFRGSLGKSKQRCIGGEKWTGGGGGSWGGAGDVGGQWYSTPMTAECALGQPVGTDGCSWRLHSVEYRNASCVDQLIDAAVEQHGRVCFDRCPQPLDRIGNCYLQCYKNTLLGDASINVTAMTKSQIVTPWIHGFDNKGPCPSLTPSGCQGPQCGP